MADEKVMEWIQRDLDGDLSNEEKEMLEFALAGSPENARLRVEMEELSRTLSRLPKVEPPVSVVDRVLEMADSGPSKSVSASVKKPRRPFRGRWMPAAAVVAAGFAGWLFFVWGDTPDGQYSTFRQDSIREQGSVETESGPPIIVNDSGSPLVQVTGTTPVASEDGRLMAVWDQGVLIVRDKQGKEKYRSRAFPDKTAPEMIWKSPRVLRLHWPANGRVEWITVETDSTDR
ncbi:hypothetical protein [Staphylospora marina]|uniref:hypothetical protein n=1 Tax=Staphylospora marina TaxID=2490858 RepID=UPI000F5B8B08|nr:hypothetical protein [Staphylospora marina]